MSAKTFQKPTLVPKIGIDSKATTKGVVCWRVVAVAKLRKSKEIKKHNCAKAKKPPLKIANHNRGILGKKLKFLISPEKNMKIMIGKIPNKFLKKESWIEG